MHSHTTATSNVETANGKCARRVDLDQIGAEEDVVDGHTQKYRAGCGGAGCAAARAAPRADRRPLHPHTHMLRAALKLRLSSTTPTRATLLKQTSYLPKFSHTLRSAAGNQQRGNHAL